MITDDPERLPTSIVGLFSTAAGMYVRRWQLYGLLALLAIAVQYTVGVLLPHTDGLVAGLEIIVDAFLVAAVTIGVALDLARKNPDWSTILTAASERWGVVTVVALINFILVLTLAPSVFGDADDTGYGLFILPIITFWGSISLGEVVAAIEPAKSRLFLPLHALGKAMAVSFRSVNLGRLVLLSCVLVLPNVVDTLLYDQLTVHGVRNPMFWSNIPLDALTVGPLQALATVFYIDFLRRATRR